MLLSGLRLARGRVDGPRMVRVATIVQALHRVLILADVVAAASARALSVATAQMLLRHVVVLSDQMGRFGLLRRGHASVTWLVSI